MCIYNPIVGFYIHLPWRAHSVGSKFALSRAPGNARILLADYACTVVAMDEEEEPVMREWQVLFARVAARRVTSCGCEHPGACGCVHLSLLGCRARAADHGALLTTRMRLAVS